MLNNFLRGWRACAPADLGGRPTHQIFHISHLTSDKVGLRPSLRWLLWRIKKYAGLLVLFVALWGIHGSCVSVAADWQHVLRTAQSKVVKIYGAGGLRQLEAYQTGLLISPSGHVLTAWSYVLDTDDLVALLDDGSKWQATLQAYDPVLELAVLKLPVGDTVFPYFDLGEAAARQAREGQRVLVLSNLFGIATGDEAVSVLQGTITAVAPLDARRGAYRSPFRGDVYILDASANNPGAAGGGLVDWDGQLLGVLGKELRSRVTGTWLNYALPAASIHDSVQHLLRGQAPRAEVVAEVPQQPATAPRLGFVLIPPVLARTPPYVDSVFRNSAAEEAGLRPDDLVVFVGDTPIPSVPALEEALARHELRQPLMLSVLRDGDLLELELKTRAEAFVP